MTHNKSASDAALEFAKHLITLSAGVIAFSATFVAKFESAPDWSIAILGLAWLALAVSVASAIRTVSGIVKSRLCTNDDWSINTGEKSATLSRWAFLVGLGLFAAFGMVALVARWNQPAPPDQHEETSQNDQPVVP